MKRKLLLLMIRLIRFFKMEDLFMPVLNAQPENGVKVNRIYRHYGRIVLARPNPNQVEYCYTNHNGERISKQEYEALKKEYEERMKSIKQGPNISHLPNDKQTYENAVKAMQGPNISHLSGRMCEHCALHKTLPCRCDFENGLFSGYYELIQTSKQYADNPTI